MRKIEKSLWIGTANSVPLFLLVLLSFKKWSFETPKLGSKYPLRWRITKNHYQIRWTIHKNGLRLKNYIRKCAYTRNNYRCRSKNCIRLADWFWLILSIRNGLYLIFFFTNVLVTPNLITWNEKLLKISNFAKLFTTPNYEAHLWSVLMENGKCNQSENRDSTKCDHG